MSESLLIVHWYVSCITCGLPLDCGLKLEVHTELGTRAHWKFKALLLWVLLHEDQDFHHVTTDYHLVTRLPIAQAVSANQNIANKILCKKPKAWSQKLRHNNGVNKGWWIPNRTFKISNDACLLMMSDDILAAGTQDKLLSFKSLRSDSNHCAVCEHRSQIKSLSKGNSWFRQRVFYSI